MLIYITYILQLFKTNFFIYLLSNEKKRDFTISEHDINAIRVNGSGFETLIQILYVTVSHA